MALSKPRRITVNGIRYHWKVSANRDLHLVVLDPATKRKLVVYFPDRRVVTPQRVRSYIEQAEGEGWTGEVRLKP
jgi:hypothetical protein